jgi:hypothetical protein
MFLGCKFAGWQSLVFKFYGYGFSGQIFFYFVRPFNKRNGIGLAPKFQQPQGFYFAVIFCAV